MRTILDEIVSSKLVEISKLKENTPLSECIATPLFNRSVISLRNALQNHFGIIAEIKRKSPSAGIIAPGLEPGSQVAVYEKTGAAAISVLTDHPYFGGSIEDLRNIRSKTDLPILRKEFILDEYQLFESKAAGADSILLIASILEKEQAHHLTIVAKSLGLEVLFEIHSFEELHKINDEIDLLLVNNRNLKTQETSLENSFNLAAYLPENIMKISASGISNTGQLVALKDRGYNGALIGESLLNGTFNNGLHTQSPVL